MPATKSEETEQALRTEGRVNSLLGTAKDRIFRKAWRASRPRPLLAKAEMRADQEPWSWSGKSSKSFREDSGERHLE